ncbi:MAG: hypothetical protein D6711_14240 [Chloroflexi bacterium]|nr:MAG: hypothetical protein D6711_14240 [Chloroflexota bacterium]
MFDDIKITHNDKGYTIQSDNVLKLVAQVERIISVVELAKLVSEGTPPLASIAMAYGIILRYAGATITDEEIYREFFSDSDAAATAQNCILTLLQLMVPDLENPPDQTGGDSVGK